MPDTQSVVFSKKTTLTNEQIKSLPTVSIDLTETPTNNVFLAFQSMVVVSHIEVPYTNVNAGSILHIAIGDDNWSDPLSLSGIIDTVMNEIQTGQQSAGGNGDLVDSLVNMPLKVTVNNHGDGNFTGGGAANYMTITTSYIPVNL